MFSSQVSRCPETCLQDYWNLSNVFAVLFGLDSICLGSGDSAALSLCQPLTPKVWWHSESQKNSYQLQMLQIWFFSLHWIKLKSVTLEVQRAMQQIRPLPGFAKSYINEATYPFSLAISPELASSFPCSWSLPTEINLAAVRSADPVWFGTRKDNLTWKISDCLRGAEGGWECSLRGRLGHPSKRWKERKGG